MRGTRTQKRDAAGTRRVQRMIVTVAAGLLVAAAGTIQASASPASAGAGAAAGPDAGCPASVAVRQAATAPAGWAVAYDQKANGLAMVTFFEGPPAELASLVYDEQTSKGGEIRAVWRFPAGNKGIWMSCAYDGTRVVLSRQLPASVRTCTVKYDKTSASGGGLPAVRGIGCQ
jgi:hypothetical protein